MKKEDIPSVIQLFLISNKSENKQIRWDKAVAEKYILKIYRSCKDLCFVMTDKGNVICCSMSCIIPRYTQYILNSEIVLVHPKYRKMGLAKKILRKTCMKAKNKYNINNIETNIFTLTDFPIMWYESVGFRKKKNFELLTSNIDNVLKFI